MTEKEVKCSECSEQCKRAPVCARRRPIFKVGLYLSIPGGRSVCDRSAAWCGSGSLPVCVPGVDPLWWGEVMDDAWKKCSHECLSEQLPDIH